MSIVHVSVGSNIEPEKNIRSALNRLGQRYGNLSISSVYESRAVGFEGPNFLNLVLGLETQEPLLHMRDTLRSLEAELGRTRKGSSFSSRTIDLDLIIYDDIVLEEGGVKIPSDDILSYSFVLIPLAEIAGHLKHPTVGRTFSELCDEIPEADRQFVSVRPPSTVNT